MLRLSWDITSIPRQWHQTKTTTTIVTISITIIVHRKNRCLVAVITLALLKSWVRRDSKKYKRVCPWSPGPHSSQLDPGVCLPVQVHCTVVQYNVYNVQYTCTGVKLYSVSWFCTVFLLSSDNYQPILRCSISIEYYFSSIKAFSRLKPSIYS